MGLFDDILGRDKLDLASSPLFRLDHISKHEQATSKGERDEKKTKKRKRVKDTSASENLKDSDGSNLILNNVKMLEERIGKDLIVKKKKKKKSRSEPETVPLERGQSTAHLEKPGTETKSQNVVMPVTQLDNDDDAKAKLKAEKETMKKKKKRREEEVLGAVKLENDATTLTKAPKEIRKTKKRKDSTPENPVPEIHPPGQVDPHS